MQEIQSQIEDEFNGAEGESIYKLTNGQVWKQSRYMYWYQYLYRPQVRIVREGSEHMMYVADMDKGIPVERIK